MGNTSREFQSDISCRGSNFHDFMKKFLKLAGVFSKHFEHFGRHYGPIILELMGCLIEQIRCRGGWDKKVLEKSYLTNTAIMAIIMAAWFPKQEGLHWNPREHIDPPSTLSEKVFTFIEKGRAELQSMPDGEDKITAIKFLDAMTHLRKVFLQDVALLHKERPNHSLFFVHSLFQDPEFLTWFADFNKQLAEAKSPENDPTNRDLRRTVPLIQVQLQSIMGLQNKFMQQQSQFGSQMQTQRELQLFANQCVAQSLNWNMHQASREIVQQQLLAQIPCYDPMRVYTWPVTRCLFNV